MAVFLSLHKRAQNSSRGVDDVPRSRLHFEWEATCIRPDLIRRRPRAPRRRTAQETKDP